MVIGDGSITPYLELPWYSNSTLRLKRGIKRTKIASSLGGKILRRQYHDDDDDDDDDNG